MSQLTPSQARVVDPVLTAVAQGLKQPGLIGFSLFPRVPVMLRAGKILTFRREDFMLYSAKRAPGQNTKRLQIGYDGSPFALEDSSLEATVPVEIQQEATRSAVSIDVASASVRKVDRAMALGLEYAQATLARTYANYASGNKVTKSGTGQWSDYTSGVSDPAGDVETARDAIRAAIGLRGNTVVLSAQAYSKARSHPKTLDRIKYTGRDSATPELLAQLWGVDRVLVGDAVYSNDAGTALTDVWGKDVIVAYTDTASVADQGAPTYGYTYTLDGYPLVEESYYDRNAKSEVFPVNRSEAAVVACQSAGYMIKDAVA